MRINCAKSIADKYPDKGTRSVCADGHVGCQFRFLSRELSMATRHSLKRGFTLVVILIVVIILGILAAIVIPQFTNASQDARNSSLTSQLQTIRSQVELYKLQHLDQLPPLLGTGTNDWNDMTAKT